MKTSTQRPYEDGDEVTLLRTHPVDELPCEEVGDGIEDREIRRDLTIVGIGPVELRSNKVLPGERQDLSVHVVDGGCQEQQSTDNPAEVGHSSSFYRSHF